MKEYERYRDLVTKLCFVTFRTRGSQSQDKLHGVLYFSYDIYKKIVTINTKIETINEHDETHDHRYPW